MILDFTPREKNLCSEAGAEEIKQRIESYWAERGYDVRVQVVRTSFHSTLRGVRHDVRSDMCNGMPARRLNKERRHG